MLRKRDIVLPKTNVVETTRVRQVVVMRLRFEGSETMSLLSWSTNPKAMAPRMIPEMNTKRTCLKLI